MLKNENILSKNYWYEAVKSFGDIKMIVFAALIVAVRVILKPTAIPLAAGLKVTFDCYVNALGSLVYGPVMALAVGAVSDTLGYLYYPSGPYFLPYILVEMMSSFIFALFLWKRKLTVPKIILSKFTVNFVCNIILNSVFNKWQLYLFSGVEKAEAYDLINLARIVKNLVLFPFEGILIAVVLSALLPALKQLKLVSASQPGLKVCKKDIITVIILAVFSIALVLFYIFWLKDFIKTL